MTNQANLCYELDIEQKSRWLVLTHNSLIQDSLCYVQELGDFYCREQYYTLRKGLDSFLIKYTLDGNGILEYNDKTEKINTCQAFWIDCKNYQNYHTDALSKRWHVIWAHFYGGNSKQLYEWFLHFNNNSNVVMFPPGDRVVTLLEELMSLYSTKANQTEDQDGIMLREILSALILQKIMVACIRAAVGAAANNNTIPSSMQEARDYIAQNYASRITLSDMGRKFSMNPCYFQKLFKKYFSTSPNEFLILTRMDHAEKLLLETNLPIASISYMIGIENVSHFINLFKKSKGVTPGVFRKNKLNPPG